MKNKKIFVIWAILLLSLLFSLNSLGIVISPSLQIHQQFFPPSKEPIRFHGYTEENCYVVAVSSSHPIHIEDFDFEIYREDINIPTMGNHFYGVFLTNGRYISGGFGGILDCGKEGKLDYLHFEFGRFNFTYNDIYVFDRYPGGSGYYTESEPRTLPSGTWYFIFAQGFWRIKWIKPNGIETLNTIIIHNYHIPDVFTSGQCECGIGVSGEYTLMTSAIYY